MVLVVVHCSITAEHRNKRRVELGGIMAFGSWFIPRQIEAENKVKREQEEKKVIQTKSSLVEED